jgi:predicted enzyme related to lactoylglutathione lyase
MPSAHHVGITVSNLDRAVSFYDSLPEGVRTLSEPQTTESGTRICFLQDSEGNLVEVLDA